MNRWTQTMLLAKREFLTRAKSKVFLVATGVIALVIIAIGPAVSLFADDPEPIRIGIVGTEQAGIEEGLTARAALSEQQIEITRWMQPRPTSSTERSMRYSWTEPASCSTRKSRWSSCKSSPTRSTRAPGSF